MNKELYPLKFHPILKSKIWGGSKLRTILNKPTDKSDIGESWEISDVEGDTSIISNGKFAGQSLKHLLSTYGPKLVGEKNYKIFGDKFPLLIKFIDAKSDLSIQLHPNDELASKRHNSFGKTEMWYVMQADDESNLIVGFNDKITPEIYLEHLENKSLPDILNFDNVTEGDTYFIEVGRVHAIGAGILLAEIQQTSDITYRVYDWDRVDAEGNSRELHNDLAIDAINFDMPDDFRKDYRKVANTANSMVKCGYFSTQFLPISGSYHKENTHDSFLIYMCVGGEAVLNYNDEEYTLSYGESVLIPASIKSFKIVSQNAKLLEVYV